jgi:hypothetical protein
VKESKNKNFLSRQLSYKRNMIIAISKLSGIPIFSWKWKYKKINIRAKMYTRVRILV